MNVLFCGVSSCSTGLLSSPLVISPFDCRTLSIVRSSGLPRLVFRVRRRSFDKRSRTKCLGIGARSVGHGRDGLREGPQQTARSAVESNTFPAAGSRRA